MKSARYLAIALLACASSSVLAQSYYGAVRAAPVASAAPIAISTSIRLPVAVVLPPPPPITVRPLPVLPQICQWRLRADGGAVQRCN